MNKMKLVMVGNGMAGARTLEELLKIAPDVYDITVFGAEPHANYNRILLSPVLAGEMTIQDIMLNDIGWYGKNNISLHLGKKVVKIERGARKVVAADGTTESYGRLLLATGSNPFILPVPGKDLEGVLTYRDIQDTNAMIEASKKYKHAVVIGGGLLGLEAANGLKLRGMNVTVVHLMEWLMERQLDRAAAELLQQSLEAKGLQFLLKTQTAEILGNADGRVRAVRFKDGSEIVADLVVMAVGIRPNTELAEAAGIRCNRGIVVNDTMQTYDPKIYAVGECAAHRGIAYGLVAPLFEMAKVCANHLAHFGIGRYAGSVTSTKLKVTGIDLFSAGEFTGGAGTEDIVLNDALGGVYKRVVLRENRIVGAVLYGDTADGSWYFDLLKQRTDIASMRDMLIFGQAHQGGGALDPKAAIAALSDDAEICGCNGVCKGVIARAITGRGLTSLDDVRAQTKASASCGQCTSKVEALLAVTLGDGYSAAGRKAMCKCIDLTHDEVRAFILSKDLKSLPAVMQ